MNRADVLAMIRTPFNVPPQRSTPAGFVPSGKAYADASNAYVACPCESHRVAFLATFMPVQHSTRPTGR